MIWRLLADLVVPRTAVAARWRCPCAAHVDAGLLGAPVPDRPAPQWLGDMPPA